MQGVRGSSGGLSSARRVARATTVERGAPPALDGDASADPLTALRGRRQWTDGDVRALSLPVVDRSLVTVGAGLASFALVHVLRVAGLPAEAVAALGPFARPYETFRYLCTTGQITCDDPLRSDSGARIDNVWGFPGHAIEDAVRRRTLRPLWTVIVEPVLREPYAPPAQLVTRTPGSEPTLAAALGACTVAAPQRTQ